MKPRNFYPINNITYIVTLRCVAGNTCSMNIDECASAPCQNGGICIDHVHGYKCNCTEDYMGDNCEHEYDVCGLFPCKNNGTCISPNKRDYQCSCPQGKIIRFRGGKSLRSQRGCT